MNLMFDIETLGTQPGYIVITVGISRFTFPEEQTFDEILESSIKIDIDIHNQEMLGLKKDKDTIKWWESQEDAWMETIKGQETALPLKQALLKMNGLWSIADTIWSFGYMDIAMVNTLYEYVGMKQGIYFRKHRDMRTISSFCTKDWPAAPTSVIKHDAMWDAAYQAYVLQRIIK